MLLCVTHVAAATRGMGIGGVRHAFEVRRASGALKTADSPHPNARICGGCITGYSTMPGTSDEGREPLTLGRASTRSPTINPASTRPGQARMQRYGPPQPRAAAARRLTTTSPRGGACISRMIGDLLSRDSHQRVYSVKGTMRSILFQPNDLLHTDRSVAVLLAQTTSGQIDVLHATNIRKIARGSIDDQGFSSVPPSTRA